MSKRVCRLSLLLIAAALAMPLSVSADAPSTADQATIEVTGRGSVSATPDVVFLNASVRTREATVVAAKQANDAQIGSIRQYLRTFGLPDEQVQTGSVSIQPILPPDAGQMRGPGMGQSTPSPKSLQPIGFEVHRSFEIELRQIDRFEELYAGLIDRGLNSFDGVRFDVQNRKELSKKALALAALDAVKTAELLAETLSLPSCTLHSLRQEGGGFEPRGRMMMAMADGGGGGLATGQIEVTASVQAEFHVAPRQK